MKRIIESAEQSNRLCIPDLEEIILLNNFNTRTFQEEIVFFANEKEKNEINILNLGSLPSKACLLIGPEGGFSDSEINMISSWKHTISISLSLNILRSETAVAAGLAQIHLAKIFYAKS